MDYKVPMHVKLAHPGTAFVDMASGLSLHNHQVKEVTNLTPHTRLWLREGGLVACTEDGTPLQMIAVAPPKAEASEKTGTTPNPAELPAVDSTANQPVTTEDTGDSETDDSVDSSEASEEESEDADSEEKSLDELLSESTGKKTVKGKGKSK